MAKDGTNRGGARAGAGRKPKALKDKIDEGKSASVIAFDNIPDFVGTDIPPPGDYLSAAQKDGKELGAVDLYIKTWKWLAKQIYVLCGFSVMRMFPTTAHLQDFRTKNW